VKTFIYDRHIPSFLGRQKKMEEKPTKSSKKYFSDNSFLSGIFKPIYEWKAIIQKRLPYVHGYEIVKKLGEGADGITYLANNEFYENIKVKIFKSNPESTIKKALDREKINLKERLARRFNSDNRIRNRENITMCYGVGDCINSDGKRTYYVVSDYVDAGSIEIKNRKTGECHIRDDVTKLDLLGKIRIFKKIASGIDVIHKSETLLKDVKLGNVLLSDDHKKLFVDDLETMVSFDSVADETRFTEGSDRYAAPEVVLDILKATEQSDIYSLTVEMLYLITGKPTEITKINNLGKQDYDNGLEQIVKEIPSVLQVFIRKGLSYDPESRYPTVEGMIRKIDEIQEQILGINNSQEYVKWADRFGNSVKTYTDEVLASKVRKLFTNYKKGISTVVDLASGKGYSAEQFKKDGSVVISVDLCKEMLKTGIETGNIDKDKAVCKNILTFLLDEPEEQPDIMLIRYALHDLPDDKKKQVFNDVYRVLKKEGQFQVIDMVATPDTKEFYNLYHKRKVCEGEKQAWIDTEEEYKRFFNDAGFINLETAYYESVVSTLNWVEEGQINEERWNEMENLFRHHLNENDFIKDYFKLEENIYLPNNKDGKGNPISETDPCYVKSNQKCITIRFPVVLICGTK
jgi:serine/threonine protein kinase